MNRILLFSLIFIMLSVPFVSGCDTEVPTEPQVTEEPETPQDLTIEITCDDFTSVNHMGKIAEIVAPGTLTVILCSNPSTGFGWNTSPDISDTSVIKLDSHDFEQPLVETEELITGAPGKDIWVFSSYEAGESTISFSYSRPWEGGEKDVWTLKINVIVYE